MMEMLKVVPERWSKFEQTGYQIKSLYYNWKSQRSWNKVSDFTKSCFLKKCFVENFFANRDQYANTLKQKLYKQGISVRNSSVRKRPNIKYRKPQLE